MDWLAILVAGTSGALAAAIATLLAGTRKERRAPYAIVTVICFFLINAFFNQAITPRIRSWQVDRQLRELSFYREFAEVEPQTYEKIRVIASDAVMKGEGANMIAGRISPLVAGIIPKYVGTASDQSVIEFIDVASRAVEELRGNQSDACYYFLFPHEEGATNAASYLKEKTSQQMLEAMTNVVHSAVHSPQQLPNAAKAQGLLITVVDRLRKNYGNDLLVLQQKPRDQAGRRKVCAITISLYKNVEDLPRSDAGLLLRYLLANKESSQTTP
jgi:hypothetical protein